jgi:hypothetical protein
MQLALKLGGYPWFLKDPDKTEVLSIHSYMNPFTSERFYLFSMMRPEGELTYQSKPFEADKVIDLLNEIKAKSTNSGRLMVLISFDDKQILEFILKDIAPNISEFMLIQLRQMDEVRLFSTYRPTVAVTPRRRMVQGKTYPVEAYEAAPEGAILRASRDEYYMMTTASTSVGTYYRGCPTPVRLKILMTKGVFDIQSILHYILSLSLEAGTSGHETRLPAPLYYLKKYASYVAEYGLPANEKVFQTLFYV